MSSIKRFELIAQAEGKVISLAQGIPSFPTPQHIRDAAKKAIDENLVDKYVPSIGILPLREAILNKLSTDNQIKVSPSQIIVTHGATEAIMSILLAILSPEDEAVILTPGYASHITQIQVALQGKNAVHVALKEENETWKFEPQTLEKKITSKTKAIVFSNPCNPTGKVFSKNELELIAQIALKHNLYIVSDEIYEYFTFDYRSHISIGSFESVKNRVISVFGVSKSYAMTGWRIGYIVASEPLINKVINIHDTLITCPTVVSQYAALAAITGPKNDTSQFKKEFEKRRKITVEALKKTDKLSMVIPEGAYYAFPRVNVSINDVELATRLIKEAKVGVVPGSAFGLGGENHIRISFGVDEETLRAGLERVVKYLNEKL